MLQFPGEDGCQLLSKNGQPLKQIIFPKIGNIARCIVDKVTPSQAFLYILGLDGMKTRIKYRAVLKLNDYKSNVDDKTFLTNIYKKGDVFDVLIHGFGDHNGMFVSTVSDGLGVVLQNIKNFR
ncbi:hypothetical protein EDEG_01074 [Edhazardia aedis USNM 41457]|uniref:S1 motif domain-containing protein n=1 Tax=Edhazardia aedis (strain USNM 41457) TaxID=1003232 RepID=J9DAG3_EDHAE|nr:hypothetical protein EDEG_01074 [Edhazardia aedis USNM 41457]|eukprot:EJW04731.1 hypothetical protein EDEG_01074 [Edhazardia aedis USNM 41457]